MYKMKQKIVASLLIFIMLLAYISTIGIYGKEVYASSLEGQTSKTNNENVEFDAYFLSDEKAVHTNTMQIQDSNYIYAKINVKNVGYLKNAKIEYTDSNKETSNFLINGEIESEVVSKIENNKISLNQIENGNNTQIKIPIKFSNTENTVNISNFNKQNIVKLSGIYVDGNGKENKIEKEIKLDLSWTATPEALIEIGIGKFVPYNISGEKGLLLQTVVKTNLKDNVLPVKQSNMEIEVPSINNIKPTSVKVVATTQSTNGDITGEKFSTNNYTYDVENNKINIQIDNIADEKGNISWNKNAQDEFIVTYMYSEEALNSIGQDGAEITIKAKTEVKTYSSNQISVEKEYIGTATLKDQIGNLVEYTLETLTENLSKGYIYSNYNTNEKVETEYKEKVTANIGLSDITDKIIISSDADNFTKNEGKTKGSTTFSGNNYSYYKNIVVKKSNFDNILGQDGKIQIYFNDTLVSEINKDTETDKSGNIIVNLSELNINNIRIETSKPVKEGKLEFNISKALKGDIGYNVYQMREFDKLEMNIKCEAKNGDNSFVSQTISKSINLVEPTTQAEIQIDNSNLSTVVTNQDVKITAILKTNNVLYNLYKNPTISITLPSYIENINIKDISLLFDNELKIKSSQLLNNADGTKTILINIEGTQTKYSIDAVSGGANIVVTADITVNKLTPNKQSEIKLRYSNANVITKTRAVEENEISTPVTFVAPTGVVAINSISNYADNAQKLTSISGEEQIAKIETIAAARTAIFEMNVINNYTNTIDNISILGRVPFKGNSDIATSKDLGSTMDLKLKTPITVQGIDAGLVTIYYSENGQASKDLANTANGWTTTPNNIENIKSYLIVLNGHTMNTGDNISFTYNAEIPENLNHNEYSYENYVVYFNNNLAKGTLEDKVIASKVGVTTGTGPVLEATMASNVKETQEILAGNIIKYEITVKNSGTEDANNVKATIQIPKYFSYVEEDKTSSLGYKYVSIIDNKIQLDLGNITKGKSTTKQVWLKIAYFNDKEDIIKTELQTTISSEGLKDISTNIVKNTIKKAYFEVNIYDVTNRNTFIKENSIYKMQYNIKSTEGSKIRENTIINIILPEELEYKSIKLTKTNIKDLKEEDITSQAILNYDERTRTLNINIGKVDGYYGTDLEIETQVGKIKQNIYEKQITVQASIKANEIAEEKISNLVKSINKPGLKLIQTANIPEGKLITAGEDFNYILEIENLSNIDMNDIQLIDYLPKGLIYKNMKVTYQSNTTTSGTKVNEEGYPIIKLNIAGKSKAKIEINVLADILEENTKITNRVIIQHKDIQDIESNIITHTIEAYNGEIPETEEKKRIMGIVWQDANNDGIKDETEDKISNVEVMLFNNRTGKLVTNSNGDIIKEKTNEDGSYTFKDIPKGEYTVIFLYDTANYSATIYRKENVDETKNSDAVDSKITLDGVSKIAGITEAITITDTNIYNIDLGLIVNKKFDLKLDKTVSSITVQNSNGTNKYEYNDSKLAKRDLVGKQIDSTTVIVEYKIKVTNEGAVPGYAKKIVDYMPTELKFSSELNRDWYTSGSGTIFNSSLANTVINPGETKEVTLILTKKMTEEGLGLINNKAEIYEAYNDLGLTDIDSTPGNKVSEEDDISSADVLLTVKTGEYIIFIGLTITIIATIAVGAYFIKKRIIR